MISWASGAAYRRGDLNRALAICDVWEQDGLFEKESASFQTAMLSVSETTLLGQLGAPTTMTQNLDNAGPKATLMQVNEFPFEIS